MTAAGRSSHLAICLTEQAQCRRVSSDKSLAASMAAARSRKLGSKSAVAGACGGEGGHNGHWVNALVDQDGWGFLGMYMVADWEIVYSIYQSYIGVFRPNHGSVKYKLMYGYVL